MKDKIFESKLKDMLEYHRIVDDERRLELRIYKVRWIWYHTILAGLMFFANIIMLAIFTLLAVKL